jgi:hypothetical protein
MGEYFDISLIVRKTNDSKKSLDKFLNDEFGLSEGENEVVYFGGRKILISSFEDEEIDFDEISIAFREQIFHKKTFKEELQPFTFFIDRCFEWCNEIQFALCSYELNGYLLRNTKMLKEFNEELLKKFPIVYKRDERQKFPMLIINLEAQEILV